MMKNTLRRTPFAAAAALAATSLVMVGCGSDDEQDADSEAVQEENGGAEAAGDHPEVEEDLEEARQVVVDGLDEFGDQSEFLLADDVSTAEQKYGMWVLPFEYSDATEEMTSQVNIDGGDFTIEAVAADDGSTYSIDQDGNITAEED